MMNIYHKLQAKTKQKQTNNNNNKTQKQNKNKTKQMLQNTYNTEFLCEKFKITKVCIVYMNLVLRRLKSQEH